MPIFIKKRSLFSKYFSLLSIIILLCFTVLAFSLLIFTTRYFRNQKRDLLLQNAKSISEMTRQTISPNKLEVPKNSAILICNTLQLISNSIGSDVFYCTNSGKITLCKERASNFLLSTPRECSVHDAVTISRDIIDEVYQRGYSHTGYLNGLFTERQYIVGVPIRVNDQDAGVIFACTSMADVQPFVLDVFRLFLIAALSAFLIALIGGYAMTYRLTRPLRDMAQATRRFSSGDFSYKVPVERDDEIGALATAFNTMALSLATQESTRRSFVANVSHELKTPMTTIGGFIDGILDGTIPPEKQSHYLQIVSDEVKRLSRLVVVMLNMSKIEAGELRLKPTNFDIAQEIFQVLVAFEQAIENKNIQIVGLEDLQSVKVNADKDMIHQVIYNLVDNAVKFTPESGTIQVSCLTDGKRAAVSVKNSGEGIPSEELAKIFDRFYKVDKSRSMDKKGTGLGLYIVRTIVEMHHGKIAARSRQGEYTEFVFWIPCNFESSS